MVVVSGRSVIGGCQLLPLAMDTDLAATAAAIATGRATADCRELLCYAILDLTSAGTHTYTPTRTCDKMCAQAQNLIKFLICTARRCCWNRLFPLSRYKIDGHSTFAAINCHIIRPTSYLLKQFGEHKSLGIYKKPFDHELHKL